MAPPTRFFSRDGGLFKFQLETGLPASPHPQSRRLVAYIFHPTEPFVISIQKASYDFVVSFHFRNITPTSRQLELDSWSGLRVPLSSF